MSRKIGWLRFFLAFPATENRNQLTPSVQASRSDIDRVCVLTKLLLLKINWLNCVCVFSIQFWFEFNCECDLFEQVSEQFDRIGKQVH